MFGSNLVKRPITLTRRLKKISALLNQCFQQSTSPSSRNTETKSSTATADSVPAGKMLAWHIESYGNEDVMKLSTQCPEPIIRRPSDVKVQISATSLNPIDKAMMGGYGSVLLNTIYQVENCCSRKRTFPIILGRDFVGRVEATGHNVSNIMPGDEVWGVVSPWEQGAHAQKVVVPASNVRRKPASIAAIDMAALPYVSVTAWSALQVTGELAIKSRGRRVLILGGAGGVGSVAVQMARAWGAHVVATCSTDAVPLVESLGVHGVVDYTQPDAMRQLMDHGHFDVVLDAAGIGPSAGIYADCLKHWANAKYVTLSSPLLRNIDQNGLALGLLKNVSALISANVNSGLLQKGASSRWGFFMPCGASLDEIQRLVMSGKLTPVVNEKFSFENMADAFRRMEEGHLRGKIVVEVN